MSRKKQLEIKIGRRLLRDDRPAYIIAEGGVNHQGRLDLALKLINAAKYGGADAIKFQAFNADLLATADAPTATYQKKVTRRRSQREMLRRLTLSPDDFRKLAVYAGKKKIDFIVTPFDEGNLELVISLKPKAVKWSSGELTNLPLLKKAARSGLPLLMSTGMSEISEVDAAFNAVRSAGCRKVALLHCVSAYPTPVEALNLRTINLLRERYNVPVGFSDHTTGMMAAPVARALGAFIIEKHMTLGREMVGPDHPMSLEPDDFLKFVHGIRLAESALGKAEKKIRAVELDSARVAKRSVVALKDIRAGEKITRAHVGLRRPGTGIIPTDIAKIIGRVSRKPISAGMLIRWNALK